MKHVCWNVNLEGWIYLRFNNETHVGKMNNNLLWKKNENEVKLVLLMNVSPRNGGFTIILPRLGIMLWTKILDRSSIIENFGYTLSY